MYKYLFGPVPSRRLGMSLGIDLVPAKVCSLNCVYCEVGKTTDLTLTRKEYVPYDGVIAELSDYLVIFYILSNSIHPFLWRYLLTVLCSLTRRCEKN